MNTFEEFDVMHVPLEKINLVEASAGTGKTFSIAVMVLRLILEKNINVKEVLLVTFTNNAVAELDERIRFFLRSAFDYAKNGKETSAIIRQIVDRSVNTLGKEETTNRLNNSILFLDETSVMTIHSFCHQTLNNLAFETGQLFESELVTNFDDVITAQIQEFWRNHIVTLPVETLAFLSEIKFDQDAIKDIVKNFLSGKRYHAFSENQRYHTADGAKQIVGTVSNFDEVKQKAHQDCSTLLQQYKSRITQGLEKDHHGKNFIQHLEDVDTFIANVKIKRKVGYINKYIPEEILIIIDQLSDAEENFQHETKSFIDLLYCAALEQVTAGVAAYCNARGIQSYDDLIKNLHMAMQGPNKAKIIASLKRQYRAVFIDEFQDTDKLQYDIFLGAFGSGEILFLIGDPKQSIYAFRQADINTYFKAYKDADNRYKMNINFRSSAPMIESMNEFFMPKEDFDFFHFGESENSIRYFKVTSPKENTKGYLISDGKQEKGITIRTQQKKEIVQADVGRQVYELLTDEKFQIKTAGGTRKIAPADIGILVKNKDYGREIRQVLGRYNIPSVFVADEKIMESDQASDLYRVLKAVFDPAMENINAALINSFTGYRSADAMTFDAEKVIELFKGYKLIWETQSIYSSLSSFIADFGIEDHLRNPGTPNGLRIITNLYQLMELLHKTAYHQRLNQAELLNWYKRALEVELLEKDESTLRLESDADAVTIMTIHKSKGLQFNIVIAAQMDFQLPQNRHLASLYQGNEYITIPGKEMTEAQQNDFRRQSEQEFRRLMYVSVTRAVYKAYVFHNAYYGKLVLSKIIAQLQDTAHIEVLNEEIDPSSIDYTQKFHSQKNNKPIPAQLNHPFQLKDPHWRYMSYSGLAAKDAIVSNRASAQATLSDYDDFVFQKLKKGNVTGNMIHSIFERINFGNNEFHAAIIADAVHRFAGSHAKIYQEFLPVFTQHILQSVIDTGNNTFPLSAIRNEDKIAEMEFDFTTSVCNPDALSDALKKAGISIFLKSNEPLHGLMKGFIDLLFEYEGKFYILDWKSNFLGDSVENYDKASLEIAMQQLNYQLQFVIYTLAVKKYLMSRIGRFDDENFGGVIYCFVRGMRSGTSNGIYFYRPSQQMIDHLEKILAPTQSSVALP